MMPPLFPTPGRLSRLLVFIFLPALAGATPLEWNPALSPTGPSGGSGTWDSVTANWWDGAANVVWPAPPSAQGQAALFGAPAGTVTVSGQLTAGSIQFGDSGYALSLNYGQAAALAVHGDLSGAGQVRFPSSGQVARYTDAVLQRGLHFSGGGAVGVAADLVGQGLQGAPVLGVWGAGTVVTLHGRLSVAGDGGQTFVSIAPRDGGRLVFADDAEVDLILDGSFFTRQLWVHGDGTGTLEFAPGFVADRTAGGTVPDGMGSYRISNTTLVTHHTQSLPTSGRPDGAGGTQINGHLVFENAPGSVWRVLTNPQTYNAGVWIQQDTTIDTQQDLTHTGVTTFSSHSGSYWAANAFQTDADDVTVTKTGPAALILAAEAAFRPGAVLRVEGGEARFLTDPAAGVQKSIAPQPAGPNLRLEPRWQGTAALLAPLAQLRAIDNLEGTAIIGGAVLLTEDFIQNHQEFIGQNPAPNRKLEPEAGTLVFRLGAQEDVYLHVAGAATLGGFLQIEREPDYLPPPGTVFDILYHGARSGQFAALNDFSDLGVLVDYLPDRIRLTTTRAAGRTGVVIDEDFTTGAFAHPGWYLLNNPAQVGFFPTNNRAGIPLALVHRVDHPTFTWGVAFLDTPTFRVGPDEVMVQQMTTFSDVANSSSRWYTIEIAALHADSHAPFGHNRSVELSRSYATNAGDQWQVTPSVYNEERRVNHAHHSGGSTSTTLLQTEHSTAVFRPDGDGGSTRVEAFGNIASNANLTIPHPLEHWNNLQISMPRQWRGTGDLLASGVARADAQLGMAHVHVGITHRTDANLDYVTDAADFIIWNSHRGQSGTHLQTGDFTNSRSTGMDDLALLLDHLGTVHDPGFNRSLRHFTLALPGGGNPPQFVYYQSSGRMAVVADGDAVSAWRIPGPVPLSRAAPSAGDWWQAHVAGREQAVDASLAGVDGAATIATYVPHMVASDFGPVQFGFAAGGGGEVAVTIVASDPLQPPAETVLLDEDFSDLSNWLDLSKAVTWAGSPPDGSVFQISSGALNLNDASRQATMWGDNGIRSFSAIDHVFPQPAAHRTNQIAVEWRMRWSAITTTGENSRVALMLLHDYPEGGLDLTPDARVYDLSQHWFARPAYQVRVRGGFNPPDAASYFMYGGGLDPDGEFEKAGNPPYWLPGFVSGAGGVTPGTNPIYNYPLNSWYMGTTAPASTTFKRYRYVVLPNAQQLWLNHNDDGQTWELDMEMPLPFEEDAPDDPAPPLYRYFEHLEGLRLYFRSPGAGSSAANVFIDSLRVSVAGDYGAPADPLLFAAWAGRWFGADYGDPALEQSLWGRDASPSGDGFSNALKAGMGLDPFARVPDGWLRLVPEPAGGWRYIFPVSRNLPSSQWRLEYSDNLQPSSWMAVPPEHLEHLAREADYDLYQATLAQPGAEHPAFFLRLRFP